MVAPGSIQSTVVSETLSQQTNLVLTFLTLVVKEEAQQQQQQLLAVTSGKVSSRKSAIEVAEEVCGR